MACLGFDPMQSSVLSTALLCWTRPCPWAFWANSGKVPEGFPCKLFYCGEGEWGSFSLKPLQAIFSPVQLRQIQSVPSCLLQDWSWVTRQHFVHVGITGRGRCCAGCGITAAALHWYHSAAGAGSWSQAQSGATGHHQERDVVPASITASLFCGFAQ